MNICVSTVYDAANCGAFLQAYALKKVLEKEGHNVQHVKYVTNRERKHHIFHWEEINTFEYLKRHLGFTYKNYKIYKKAIREFNEISPQDVKKQDLLIIGSDELWNVTNETILDYVNKSFYQCKNKIAFSISCGNATSEDLLKNKELTREIKQMKAIFPRDEQTKRAVEELTQKECPLVCDPTLCLNIDEYPSYKYQKRSQKYMLYYGYWTEEKSMDNMRKYANQHGLEINAVGMKNYRCENNIVCHPLDFIQYIKDADVVVTSTFHGTIFSLLCQKDVICLNFGSRKLEDLVKRMGIEERLISENTDFEQFERLLSHKIDYRKVNKNIEKMREKALKYLHEALIQIED